MKCLEELEKKVLQIVQKNKELQNKVVEVTRENDSLTAQVRQFEASLLKENTATKSLAEEKTLMKSSIEDLLKTIKTLENEQ